MKILFSVILVVLFFGLLHMLFLRLFVKKWWQNKRIRQISYALPIVGLLCIALWKLGMMLDSNLLIYPAVVLAILILVSELCLILTYPISGLLHLINFSFDSIKKKANKDDTKIDLNRRKVLLNTAAAIPLISLSTGSFGIIKSYSSVNVFRKPIAFENLPDDLNGFRILHLSDLHLRHYVTLDDLEEVLRDAEKFFPDMVVVTGDIADDLDLLPDALNMIDQLNTPNGAFASLGNHEHYRGIRTVRHHFDNSPVPLFVNHGETIKIGDSLIFIGGIDDPKRMGAKENKFFQHTIDETLNKEHGSDFKLLMSHRPDALDYASQVGIDLTLAGHTHGGQMGYNGRSVLESEFPDRYLWGDYSIDKSKLYTTSGMGHWFPFRLGCPTEAPVIELVKS